MQEPVITVGILSGKEIGFSFPKEFISSDGIAICGIQQAVYRKGKICWQEKEYDELSFTPQQDTSSFFELQDVTIGINFHWERKEVQRFKGELKIIVEDDRLTAINIIPIEDYLTSVISSEMSATASLELLKAHAVISRSWLLNKLKVANGKLKVIMHPDNTANFELSTLPSQLIKWYDHEAHKNFDVCADDHCQRYQGITRTSTPQAIEAVFATRGEVLMYEGEICDARFSKCCGGAFEEFQNCWENVKHPYLIGQRDSKTETRLPDLTKEAEADKWIRTSPAAFCNTHNKQVLSQVLNNYDQETTDFYRWRVCYSQQELSELIHKRSGIEFGKIIDLIPVERGTSGRLVRLKIVGTLRTLIIGKELEIRRTLSSSHLYSSAFVVDKEYKEDEKEIPSRFILTGSGWGHGVGLCQIGAAVMGEQGYKYKEILSHYYPGSAIEQQYKDSVVTSQRKDEVEAMYKAALAAERAAYEQYQMAVDGAQTEDKASAASMVDAARSTVDEVSALLVDARLTAPEDGQIATIFPKRGELVAPGTPIMNLVVMNDVHVVLNVREDLMPQFKMGETFVADVPAIDKKNIEFKIYYISPLGSFATWKSTKQVGSYDLRTFEIHARPTQKIKDLRPGMSVLLTLN